MLNTPVLSCLFFDEISLQPLSCLRPTSLNQITCHILSHHFTAAHHASKLPMNLCPTYRRRKRESPTSRLWRSPLCAGSGRLCRQSIHRRVAQGASALWLRCSCCCAWCELASWRPGRGGKCSPRCWRELNGPGGNRLSKCMLLLHIRGVCVDVHVCELCMWAGVVWVLTCAKSVHTLHPVQIGIHAGCDSQYSNDQYYRQLRVAGRIWKEAPLT